MRALLLFAYGIVESIDELEAFYTYILTAIRHRLHGY